nr:MAG TPA: tail protein [Caudoviricetes sp.]
MIQIKRNNKVFFTLEDFGEGSKLSYQLMDHHYIILKFTTATPVYFEIGDSVEIPDFGYFELTSAYFPKHNDSDGYDYEMQMDAYYMSWKNKICKYRPQHGANETSFKLTTTVGVHMNVILGNLKALGLMYNGKDFSVDYTTYNNKAFDVQKRFLIEYGSISILDALNAICSEDALNCEWWIDGSIIYLGYCEMEGQTTFELDVNVLSMSYSESKSTYITRLYAFGSDRNIPKGYFTGADADVTTDGVATDYLMLPNKEVDSDGFYAKDGYLENVNVVKNDKQAIEGVVMFDEEYPKVECMVSSIKTYDSTVDNEDGTKTTQTFWQVTSTDSFTNSFKESWIKSNLTLGIKFTSGALMGMEFDVSFKVIDKVNYFEIVANDTYGRTLPDGVMCPKVGDKYFLFNWDATKITDTNLIPTAQLSLFDRAKQYYLKTMISNSNFTCTMDGDKFYNDGTYNYHPLGEQVKLINDMFAQVDADGKHYRNSRIIGMEIPLDIPYDHPQYTVGEKAATSRLGKLEDKVDSIKVNGMQINGGNGGGGVYVIGMNDSTPPTDSNVLSARKSINSFVSKLFDDVVKGLITFEQGIKLGAGTLWKITLDGVAELRKLIIYEDVEVKGDTKLGENGTNTEFGVYNTDSTGARIQVKEDGTSIAEFDYITIRRAAQFRDITIRELRHIGGELAITPAAMVCSKVERLNSKGEVIAKGDNTEPSSFKCYFETKDSDKGSEKVFNYFRPLDQARCQQFDIVADGSKKTRYYWRLVMSVGKDYIVLSNLANGGMDSLTTSEPLVGDNIVQLGYQGSDDPNRQSAIILSSISDDAPSQKMYQGISSFSLDGCLVKDEGYDAATGVFHCNIYGDSYTGDKDGKSFFQYDSNKKEATFKGKMIFNSDSKLPDGSSVNDIAKKDDLKDLNIKSGNLLRNTSFCGDYESIDISEDTEISEDKETFSEKLKYWTMENTRVVDTEDSTSGKAVRIGGTLSQQLAQPLLPGKAYVLSFKGKGTTVRVSVGGETHDVDMTSSFDRYELHITCSDAENGVFSMVSTNCVVCEIMLSYGKLAPAWSPSYSDNDKSMAEFQNMKFLTDAITQGSTTIDGGLVMSQQFKVGNFRDKKMIKETGGMSGYYNDDDSPFLWGGGTLEQAIYTIQKYKDNPNYEPTADELNNLAKFVVTHGGRAILTDIILRGIIYAEGGVMKSIKSPNGNFEIDEEGNLKAKDVTSVGGFFKNVSISGNFYTPYTIINNDNANQYGHYEMGNNLTIIFKIDLSLSGFNLQFDIVYAESIALKKEVIVILPEEDKYLGAEVNIFCALSSVSLDNVSYVKSYEEKREITFEAKRVRVFQGQLVKLKCVKIDDTIKWLLANCNDTIYELSSYPKLTYMVQYQYDASTGVYNYYPNSGAENYIDTGVVVGSPTHYFTGTHIFSYEGDIGIVEPFAFGGLIDYTIDTASKKIKISTFTTDAKRSDNIPFGFKIYSVNRIG